MRSAVLDYAEQVLAGKVVAGRLVKLACARHKRDLQTGSERGLWFDDEAADRALRFFPTVLRLADGAFAGKPFILHPFQQFLIGSLFGWKRQDGARRFRTAYVETAKGSGKSPTAAGVGLYMLVADDEKGGEVYCAAVTRDQAGIMFRDAKRMIEASPALSRRLEVNVSNIAYPDTGSFMRPVSREAKSLDGKRVHCALIDELHEHLSGEPLDKMRKGTKGRRQSLILEITNAGYDLTSVCWEHHEYSTKVLEQVIDDDEWFALICALDPCEQCRAAGAEFPNEGCANCDDWRNEAVWPKANPLLGVTIQPEYLRREVREAAEMLSNRARTKRLNFCIWTEAKSPWLATEQWALGAAAVDLAALAGRRCFGGLDLSTSYDLTAFCLIFPPVETGEKWKWYGRFWIPENNLWERVRRDHVPYDAWLEAGHLEVTPGNVVDYDFIEAGIKEEAGRFKIVEVGYDRWAAGEIYQHLTDDGLTLVPIGQGFQEQAAPCKRMEELVRGGQFQHGGHPVLRWNVSNAVAIQDPAGNTKIDKAAPKKRIDGLAAILNAMARAIRNAGGGSSVYEERGLVSV